MRTVCRASTLPDAARVAACFAALVAAVVPGPAASAESLPAGVAVALQRARIPAEAVSIVVQEAGGTRMLLQHQPRTPMNPASAVKLLTTAMALDQLGPAWSWSTPVWLQGRLVDGVLDGNVFIKGSGDPKLVVERVWLLLRRVMQLGVREVRGDIVLDNTAFAAPDAPPGDFDGESLRPYNVRAAALLLNYRALVYTFTPDPARAVAVVSSEPPLAGLQVDATVPLVQGPCGDWTAQLKASFAPGRTRFGGSYAAACGEMSWPLADAAPATYNQRLVEALWRDMGGRITGAVREGVAPADSKPTFEQRSPPLLEVVREINKFSNNVMAQQLFLTLALQRHPGQPATQQAAREAMRRWTLERLADDTADAAADPGAELVIDNGSGLSRDNRVSAQLLARVLQLGWSSPWMSELMSSLPISGVDGTMRRARGATAAHGRAHLKTGSLRDVSARAGYVLTDGGRRWVLVAIINHANAAGGAAQPVFDALLQWVAREGARPGSSNQNR